MTNGPTRRYGRGHLHFIPFSCYRRLRLLGSMRASNCFVKILGETRDRYGFSLVGYVVMADGIPIEQP
jgi:hypothetical protein